MKKKQLKIILIIFLLVGTVLGFRTIWKNKQEKVGMSITLEVSVTDLLVSLSGNNKDDKFRELSSWESPL